MNSGKKRALRSNKNKKNNYKPRAPKRKKIVKKKMQKEVIPTNEVFTVEGIHGFSFLEERNQLKFRVKVNLQKNITCYHSSNYYYISTVERISHIYDNSRI